MGGKTEPHDCGVDHSTLRRLQVGVYEDPHGRTVHFCLAEVCESAGYEPTPENLETAEKALRDVVAEKWPGVPITVGGGREAAPEGEAVH